MFQAKHDLLSYTVIVNPYFVPLKEKLSEFMALKIQNEPQIELTACLFIGDHTKHIHKNPPCTLAAWINKTKSLMMAKAVYSSTNHCPANASS